VEIWAQALVLIKEKLEENPNYFLQPTSFLNMILETKKSKIFPPSKKQNL